MLRELLAVQEEMKVIQARLGQIGEMPDPPEGDDEVARSAELDKRSTETDDLIARWKELEEKEQPLIERNRQMDAIRQYALNAANTEPGDSRPYGNSGPSFLKKTDPFDTDPRRLARVDVISRAMTIIDREKGVPVSDQNKGHLEWLIHRSQSEDEDGFDGGYIAMRTLYTENPLYRSAFRKYVRFGALAHFNEGEHKAMAALQEYEVRRAAGEVTTTAGGFGVPVKIKVAA